MQISFAAVILLQLNSVKYSSLYVYNAAIEKHLHTNFLFTLQIKSKSICFGLYQNTFAGGSTNREQRTIQGGDD